MSSAAQVRKIEARGSLDGLSPEVGCHSLSSGGTASPDNSVAQGRFAEWYGSTRYDWFMVGIFVGVAWASLLWWLFT